MELWQITDSCLLLNGALTWQIKETKAPWGSSTRAALNVTVPRSDQAALGEPSLQQGLKSLPASSVATAPPPLHNSEHNYTRRAK